MNFYLIEKADEKTFPQVLSCVKQFVKERFPGAAEDPVLKLTYEGANPFFLKTQSSVLWIGVLEESLTIANLKSLHAEMERVSQMFRQKVQFFIFAPAYAAEIKSADRAAFGTVFFEWFFLKSRFGQGVAFREQAVLAVPAPAAKVPEPAQKPLSPGAYRNIRLERDELSELINLSLELKGLVPSI